MKQIPLPNPKYVSAYSEVANMTFSLRLANSKSKYISVIFYIDGNRYERSTKETIKSKANKRAKEIIFETMAERQAKVSNSHTFNEARERYIQLINPKPNEIGYLNWICDQIGEIYIEDITKDTLWKLTSHYQKSKSPIKGQSVNRAMKPLYAILNLCLKWDWTDKSYTQEKLRIDQPKERRALSEGEVNRLLSATIKTGYTYLHDPILFYLLTALRKEELNRIKKEDILDNGSTLGISIQKNGTYNEKIPLNQMAQKIVARNIAKSKSDYLFSSPNSIRGNLGEFKKAWAIVKKEANVETDIHSLRHTAITNVSKGVDSPYRLKQFSRHKTESGLKPYLHLMDKDRREIVELSNVGIDQNYESDVGSYVGSHLKKG